MSIFRSVPNLLRPTTHLILLSMLCLLLAACNQASDLINPDSAGNPVIFEDGSPIKENSELQQGIETKGEAHLQDGSSGNNVSSGILQPPSNDPARFVFPTSAPAPISAWRPPLYPVPWALNPYDHFYFTRPVPVDEINWPLANYRYGGIFFEDVVHTGVDIPGPVGTPILAAGAGKVVWAGFGLLNFSEDSTGDPYGLAIGIRHDFGYQNEPLYTLYAHMSEIYVVRDQIVQAGELIGLMGETGVVTGPHLHFEVRVSRNDYFATRNPELWIAPPQGWGVLTGRAMNTRGDLLPRHEIIVTSLEPYKIWSVITYGPKSVNSDPYYNENVVMGDLPAGRYRVELTYEGTKYTQLVDISPGQVTYFDFRGEDGFSLTLPPTPVVNFQPNP